EVRGRIEAGRKAAEEEKRAAAAKAAEEKWTAAMDEVDRWLLERQDVAGARKAAGALREEGPWREALKERAAAVEGMLGALEKAAEAEKAALEGLVGKEVNWQIGGEIIKGTVTRAVGTDKVVVTRKVAGATMDWPVKVSAIPEAERARIFAKSEPAEGIESVAAAVRRLAKGVEDWKEAKRLLGRAGVPLGEAAGAVAAASGGGGASGGATASGVGGSGSGGSGGAAGASSTGGMGAGGSGAGGTGAGVAGAGGAAGGDAAPAGPERSGLAALAVRYWERARRLELGEAEFAAEKAWGALVKSAPAKLDRATAEKLRDAVAAFEKAHGGTAFVKDKAEEIAAFKMRVAAALDAKGYRGEWVRMSPRVIGADGKPTKLPENFGRSGGALYDLKRKLCVLYGTGASDLKRNYMWAYDSSSNAWTCIMEDDQAADGKTRPQPRSTGGNPHLAAAYDSDRDLYWIYIEPQFWKFNPETKTWAQGPVYANKLGDLFAVSFAYYPPAKAIAVPDGLLGIDGSYLSKVKGEVPKGIFYRWGSGSAASGTFSQALGEGSYLVFAASGKAENRSTATWMYDPSKPAWEKLEPKESPPAERWCHLLVYHEGLKIWVLAGGHQPGTGERAKDVWVYAPNKTTWLRLQGKDVPGNATLMWYDHGRNAIVVLCGQETWVLNIAPVFEGFDAGPPSSAAPSASPDSPARSVPGAVQPAPEIAKLDAACLQKLFRGKVESFNPATREIVLSYDFRTGREQRDDWTAPAEGWPGGKSPRRALAACFEGDFEFSFAETIGKTSYWWTDAKGGLVWRAAEGGAWKGAFGGLHHSNDMRHTFAEVSFAGRNSRSEPPFQKGQKKEGETCAHTWRVVNGRLSYAIDGHEAFGSDQFDGTSIRPVLPDADISSVRVRGVLSAEWLREAMPRM
ncbi:MAG: hypothetical protein N3A38_00990, partial [Planctomycetota bacterium]|nr:hypothetical protein [Planctomycetota bacterium]